MGFYQTSFLPWSRGFFHGLSRACFFAFITHWGLPTWTLCSSYTGWLTVTWARLEPFHLSAPAFSVSHSGDTHVYVLLIKRLRTSSGSSTLWNIFCLSQSRLTLRPQHSTPSHWAIIDFRPYHRHYLSLSLSLICFLKAEIEQVAGA